ncbi:Fatty acid amide hydrolase [Clonorchis sinensis]|uniref:Fatty acid amide hydrolase n=2 Tax=Clonorchis sinensis TaxID=79923 RepID=A0A8T1MR98_CLOSI|nr:Fatty acid amide hydrolase [Clonorchis sinensis]GAA55770.1 fatty-acid amide hydrolase 1 [Clonorchis sinensis]
MVHRAAARIICYTILDVLSILYVIDYITLRLSTELLDMLSSMALHLHRYMLFRWIVIYYIIYRCAVFGWYRYQLKEKLRKKKDDILDKHGRLHEKLKATKDPAVTVDQAGEMSISQIREQLRSKKISAVDLLDAFQRRALDTFRSSPGAIAEIVFDSDVYAILADGQLATEPPENLTPLHGIPVSLQEVFPVRGYDHTMGFTSKAKRPAEEDCAFVAALRNAGAIPFLLANSRQKLLSLTSVNPIFGRTRHPTHLHRTCVSGDGVLVAHRASPLSFAVDIIGDARLSAASCGLVGFKPTPGRVSQKGLDLPLKIPQTLGAVASPIGQTIGDIVDAFRSLWTSALFKADSCLCPFPFDEKLLNRGKTEKLTIGFYSGFTDLLPASSAVERVMNEAKVYLENKGHRVVEFAPPKPAQAYQLVISLLQNTLAPETLRVIYKLGHGDILTSYRQHFVNMLFALPGLLRKVLCYTRATRMQWRYEVASLALRGYGCTTSRPQLECEAEEYLRSFFDKWNEEELDCLLCPVSPLPAVWDRSDFYTVNGVLLYTSLYNMLGCPAGTLQYGRVEREDIYKARDSVEPGKHLRQGLMYAEQLDAAEGMPINIQVVAKPWEDELAMGLMELLEARS